MLDSRFDCSYVCVCVCVCRGGDCAAVSSVKAFCEIGEKLQEKKRKVLTRSHLHLVIFSAISIIGPGHRYRRSSSSRGGGQLEFGGVKEVGGRHVLPVQSSETANALCSLGVARAYITEAEELYLEGSLRVFVLPLGAGESRALG